jgi:nitrogen fixation NifU-like protein
MINSHTNEYKGMEKKTFDFWQEHSVNYLEMAFRYDKRERISNPDGYGKRSGDCGDMIEMFLSIRQGRIRSVSFDTDGCMNTNACCNTVAHLAEGKGVEDAWEISPEDVVGYLGTLPPENYHCAELAVGAFYLALTNYQEQCRAPWKQPYQKKQAP